MNKTSMYLANIAMRVLFIVGGVFMAYNGIKGWGWLIFGSIITSLYFDSETNEK